MAPKRYLLWAALILAAAILRVLPHAPNVTPLGALALLSGACWATRRGAFAVPLLALLLSDVLQGLLVGEWRLHPLTPVVYASLLASVMVGFTLRRGWQCLDGKCHDGRRAGVLTAVLGSSLSFFVLSNAGVWLVSGWYPPTAGGLWACYVAALPFLPSTLCGDAVYGGLLLGGWQLARGFRSGWRFQPARASLQDSAARLATAEC